VISAKMVLIFKLSKRTIYVGLPTYMLYNIGPIAREVCKYAG
jgi:hypothetical protein